MPESHDLGNRPGWPGPGSDLETLRAFTVRHVRSALAETRMDDEIAELLAARVAALEEVTAARWPRRWVLAARLRRQLRASVRHVLHGDTFTERRAEWAAVESMTRYDQQKVRRRHSARHGGDR